MAVLVAAALCLPVGAQPAEINVSQDLVALGIADQNLAPNNPNLDARPLFQAALNFALKNGIPKVVADTGAYYFLTPGSPGSYLSIKGYSGLSVDLQGSNVYMAASYLVWFLCSELQPYYFNDLNLDALQLPFTQVRLTGVAAQQWSLNYSPVPGWTSPTIFNSIANPDMGVHFSYWLWFPQRCAGPRHESAAHLSAVAEVALFQVTQQDEPWTQPSVLATYQPGDTIVFMARGSEAPILIEGGDSDVLSNIDFIRPARSPCTYNTSNAQVQNVRVLLLARERIA